MTRFLFWPVPLDTGIVAAGGGGGGGGGGSGGTGGGTGVASSSDDLFPKFRIFPKAFLFSPLAPIAFRP